MHSFTAPEQLKESARNPGSLVLVQLQSCGLHSVYFPQITHLILLEINKSPEFCSSD